MAKKVQIDIVAKDKASKQMKTVGKSANAMGAQVKKAALAFAAMGAIVGAVVGKMVKDWAAAGNEVHKMALRTGFATEALSEYKHALEISGASIESMDKAVKRMSKTIVDASEGMATYIRAFDRIGLSAEDLMDLAPEKQFDKIAMAIANLESPTLRAATAQDIFGRAGTQLLPMLDAGAEGIARLKQEAHELGIVFDQEAADKAALLTDEMDRLKKSIDGVKFAFAEELSPTLVTVIGLFKDLIKGEIWISEESKAYTKILEGQRKIAIEYMKVLRGEENQYKALAKTQVENIDNYLGLTKESNEYTAALARARAHLASYVEQAEKHGKALKTQNEALAKQKELMMASIDMQDAKIIAIYKEIEAQKKLAESLHKVEYERRATQLGIQARLMQQIQEAGGRISAERIQRYYELMGQVGRARERVANIQSMQIQNANTVAIYGTGRIVYPGARGGAGGGGETEEPPPVYPPGEEYGVDWEDVMARAGESFLQEAHMSGGD